MKIALPEKPVQSSTKSYATGETTYISDYGRTFTVPVFELKGRIEYSKDAQAILAAASQIDGLEGLSFDGHTVTLTWYLNFDENRVDSRCVAATKTAVNQFFTEIQKQTPLMKAKGIELHVFCESLKRADEFDGQRNGLLS